MLCVLGGHIYSIAYDYLLDWDMRVRDVLYHYITDIYVLYMYDVYVLECHNAHMFEQQILDIFW